MSAAKGKLSLPLAVSIGAALVAAGVVVGYGLSDSPEQEPVTIETAAPQAPPPGQPVVDEVGVSDPEVTKWHTSLLGPIGAAYVILADPAPKNASNVARACRGLTMAVADLQKAPKAPKPDLEQAYRGWVDALSSAVVDCPTATSTDKEREEFGARLTATSPTFDKFQSTLDLYFDFSVPAGQ